MEERFNFRQTFTNAAGEKIVSFFNLDKSALDSKIEQSTGLKDKMGKMIFQGDRVKYDGETNLFTVAWSVEGACFFLLADSGSDLTFENWKVELVDA